MILINKRQEPRIGTVCSVSLNVTFVQVQKCLSSKIYSSQTETSFFFLFFFFSRLRHNVIKAGVRMINLSYSRISLSDIALKLQLDSPEDAEFIVAKVGRHATL